jgi:NAD(P)-dependent dehydrogenase (short-subunit alcohol dehydrogenase family)
VAGDDPLAGAIARRLEADGASVRVEPGGSSLAGEARARAVVQDVVAALGALDVLVTAFSSRDDRPFLEIDDQSWQRSLDENLKSAFLVGREAARHMAEAGAGVIVHVGSDVAARPGAGTGAYAAAKAGVQLLTTVMALDLAPHGIRVCSVAAPESGAAGGPGPEDTAAAVSFCASDAASYVLGSTFFLDGPPAGRG